MHTFKRGGVTISYNSDLSGSVLFTTDTWVRCDATGHRVEVHVPGQVLLDFVAEHIRQERIAKLEQMTTDELLGLK